MRRQVWLQFPQEDPRSTQDGVLIGFAIPLRLEGRGQERRAPYASGHGQAWFHLWPVDSLCLRAS